MKSGIDKNQWLHFTKDGSFKIYYSFELSIQKPPQLLIIKFDLLYLNVNNVNKLKNKDLLSLLIWYISFIYHDYYKNVKTRMYNTYCTYNSLLYLPTKII